MHRIQTAKDKMKLLRTMLETLILLALLFLMFRTAFTEKAYEPWNQGAAMALSVAPAAAQEASGVNAAPAAVQVLPAADNGFLALSYIGVDRTGTDTLISGARLKEHLKALSDLGYVAITQQDIIDYYEHGAPLPEKALFLMFEDGRRDTAIFSDKLLRAYNFPATMLTYAEKFETGDNKFLMPKDLKSLEKSTWWEMGTNGYRLSYINAYDRYNRFLGELTSREYIALTRYMGRDYNHYLMDYIRDKDGFPAESRQAMEGRISHDYELMEQIYTETLGMLPGTYILMHANTGSFGNNEAVSQINEEQIKHRFALGFNREGYSRNDRESDLYDLTRMQPQAGWYTNHLLMRIKYDLKEEAREGITFVTGEAARSQAWSVLSGAAEFKGGRIILTSEPEGKGVVRLTDSDDWKNITVTVRLTGNKVGAQTIGLRTSADGAGGIFVTLENNMLYITQKTGEGETVLSSLDLREFDRHNAVSVEEDRRNALAAELSVRGTYSGSPGEWLAYRRARAQVEKQPVPAVADGAEEYVQELQIHDLSDRELRVTLNEHTIQVQVDGRDAISELELPASEAGGVLLEASWGGGYSQRNITDDVYDGVFEDISICSADGSEEPLYRNTLTGIEKTKHMISDRWNAVIDWVIRNL